VAPFRWLYRELKHPPHFTFFHHARALGFDFPHPPPVQTLNLFFPASIASGGFHQDPPCRTPNLHFPYFFFSATTVTFSCRTPLPFDSGRIILAPIFPFRTVSFSHKQRPAPPVAVFGTFFRPIETRPLWLSVRSLFYRRALKASVYALHFPFCSASTSFFFCPDFLSPGFSSTGR